MKLHIPSPAVLGAAALLAAGLTLSACQQKTPNSGTTAGANAGMHAQAAASASMEAHNGTTKTEKNARNWYGGPAYLGPPALAATAALVRAGGGAASFSFPQALVAMLGQKTVNAEVAKLTRQYGKKQVKMFLNGMTGAVNLGLKFATEAGITLPKAPANLRGPKLAKALVRAGTAPDGTFWAGHLFDKALSHKLHNKVMMKINMTAGGHTDLVVHKILNQAMFDVAQALRMQNVKLASLH